MQRLAKLRVLCIRKVHISWHIAVFSAGILSGTAGVLLLPSGTVIGGEWLVVAASLLIAVLARRTAYLLPVIFIGGILLGLWHGSALQNELRKYEQYYGRQVLLTGKIADDTMVGPTGGQRLLLDDVMIDGDKLKGQVWASTTSRAVLKRGDIVRVKGSLSEGFGNTPASMFRAELVGVWRPSPGDIARRWRDKFAAGVASVIPEREASLGVSFLTGMRRSLPDELSEQLRMLGLVHIVVASGFHLTIVVRAGRRLFSGISKYLATFTSVLMIAVMLLLTNFSTSMTRASLVAGISLLAWYYGRAVHPVVLLLLVAAITAWVNPAYVWGDIGWYLSFTAFIGVIILAPLLDHYFWGQDKEPGTVRHIVVSTTAAQITTLPLVAYVFGQYSPLALLANLLILPLLTWAMLFTFIAGISALVIPSISGVVALPAYAILRYMTGITGWLSKNPWAAGEIELSLNVMIGSYVLVLLLIIYLWRVTGHNFRRGSPVT